MELFIIWLALAGVTAYFAKQKGRNPVGWFILGFVFPAIGLIAVWLANPLGWTSRRVSRSPGSLVSPPFIGSAHSAPRLSKGKQSSASTASLT